MHMHISQHTINSADTFASTFPGRTDSLVALLAPLVRACAFEHVIYYILWFCVACSNCWFSETVYGVLRAASVYSLFFFSFGLRDKTTRTRTPDITPGPTGQTMRMRFLLVCVALKLSAQCACLPCANLCVLNWFVCAPRHRPKPQRPQQQQQQQNDILNTLWPRRCFWSCREMRFSFKPSTRVVMNYTHLHNAPQNARIRWCVAPYLAGWLLSGVFQ